MLEFDVLVAEIGSTTTVINAFADIAGTAPVFVGQGTAPTTACQGDVTIGLQAAVGDLREKLGGEMRWKRMYATSSAAGGLKMTVHGLVYEMTAKAGKEAALGAGAVVHLVTAGVLSKFDLKSIKEIGPNIILLAGGVDYGEHRTALTNAELLGKHLLENGLSPSVVYAGNRVVAGEVKEILGGFGIPCLVTENVYPRIDDLNVEPVKRIIQQIFEANICEAPGMWRIREMVTGRIMPTPGAVMEAAGLLYREIGDLVVFDVGGATTDVHSITEASLNTNMIAANVEPREKRTVEGDLGVYVNAPNVMRILGEERLEREFGRGYERLLAPIPATEKEVALTKRLMETAMETAALRHAGVRKTLYGQAGGRSILVGKDLTNVKWIIGTGGALARLPGGKEALKKVRRPRETKELLPGLEAVPLIDRDYIMASAGVLSLQYPDAALKILRNSLS